MLKKFISIAMVAMEIEKRHYFSYSNSCKEDKIFHQKQESYTFGVALIKMR